MNAFSENFCRICSEFFCCVKCRIKHEKYYHNIHPECNICIYGTCSLKDFTKNIIEHLESNHFPLHCIHCKDVFDTTKTLFDHKICLKKSVEYTPEVFTPVLELGGNYCYPSRTAIMGESILVSSNKQFKNSTTMNSLTTSTPMHKSNERDLLENIPETITPVDYLENKNTSAEEFLTIVNYKNKITPATAAGTKKFEPMQRRVTFCETPIITSQPFNNFNSIDDKHVSPTNQIIDDAESHSFECMKKNYYFTTDLTQYYEASNTTMWESALIKDNTNELEITDVKISNLSNIVALDPLVQTSSPVITQNIPSELLQTNKDENESGIDSVQIQGIWTSMANLVRTMVRGLSGSNLMVAKSGEVRKNSTKRLQSNTDSCDEEPFKKRIKLLDNRCNISFINTTPIKYIHNSPTKKNSSKECIQNENI